MDKLRNPANVFGKDDRFTRNGRHRRGIRLSFHCIRFGIPGTRSCGVSQPFSVPHDQDYAAYGTQKGHFSSKPELTMRAGRHDSERRGIFLTKLVSASWVCKGWTTMGSLTYSDSEFSVRYVVSRPPNQQGFIAEVEFDQASVHLANLPCSQYWHKPYAPDLLARAWDSNLLGMQRSALGKWGREGPMKHPAST